MNSNKPTSGTQADPFIGTVLFIYNVLAAQRGHQNHNQPNIMPIIPAAEGMQHNPAELDKQMKKANKGAAKLRLQQEISRQPKHQKPEEHSHLHHHRAPRSGR